MGFALPLFIVVGTTTQNITYNECETGWIQAAHVGMGCLLFDSFSALPWLDAVRHCEDKEANLVEIFTEYQLDFVRSELDMLDDHEDARVWWTGGNDIEEEGQWRWLVSHAREEDFLWILGQPNDGEVGNCLELPPGVTMPTLEQMIHVQSPIFQKIKSKNYVRIAI